MYVHVRTYVCVICNVYVTAYVCAMCTYVYVHVYAYG